MSRRDINKKLTLEISQIRSILTDFRKAKQKCLTICQQIHEQFPNKVHFDSVQRETTLKMDLLDLSGLVQLKNTLVRTLTQLFDLQNELHTKKEKYNAKKEFGNIIGGQNLVTKSIPKINKVNISLQQIDRRAAKIQQEEIEREDSLRQRQIVKEKPKQNNQQSRYNVPIYHAHDDTSENKIDRISKYIASLKRNMKQHSSHSSNTLNTETRQILMEQPIFTTMKQELQRFKMREEEIESLIFNKVQQKVKNYISNLEVIQETKDYKIIKIYKDGGDQSSLMETMHNISTGDTNNTREKVFWKNELKEKQNFLEGDSSEQSRQINGVEMDLNNNEYNVQQVVSRISQTLENSENRLRQLRDQRKKMFLDDDVWAEFEQI